MPPRKKFTLQQLKSASLTLVDERGLDALTMRGLAAVLGTGAMTLYNYVEDREGLEALLIEEIMAQVNLPTAPAKHWQNDIRQITTSVWQTVRQHPHAIPLILSRRTIDDATLDYAEAILAALARGGKTGVELYAAFRVVTGFVTGFTQAEIAISAPTASAQESDKTVQRALALPPDKYPKLVEIAKTSADAKPEQAFKAGLDIILAGLS